MCDAKFVPSLVNISRQLHRLFQEDLFFLEGLFLRGLFFRGGGGGGGGGGGARGATKAVLTAQLGMLKES